MEYSEEDMLMLSGIQHFMFCPRQWGLIHLSQEWADNRLTTEGCILHKNVDNPFYRQKNGESITLRSVHIASRKLGLYGVTDAIELKPTSSPKNAITHKRYPGLWQMFPIEYKRGHSKPDKRDEVQLAAQVICLEEMYNVRINEAALFYAETKRREIISIDNALREITNDCAKRMHEVFKDGQFPPPLKRAHCRNCSLVDICMPEISERQKATTYLKKNLYEETA